MVSLSIDISRTARGKPTPPAQMAPPTLAGGVAAATLGFAAAPDDGGDAITAYQYEVDRAGGGFSAPVAAGSAADPAAAVAVSPLAAGPHVARARAVNAVGPGPWSDASAPAEIAAPLAIAAEILSGFAARLNLLAAGESASLALPAAQAEGLAPFSWSLADAPGWLTIDAASGALTVAGAAPGVWTVTLRAQDGRGAVGTAALSFAIADAALRAPLGHYLLESQPLADPGVAYALTGTLPDGLRLCAGGGEIYGAPAGPAAARVVTVSGGSWTRRLRVSAGKHGAGAVFDGTRILCAGSGLNAATGGGTGGAAAFPPNAVDTGRLSFWADATVNGLASQQTLWNLAGRHLLGVAATGAVIVQAGTSAIGDRVNAAVNLAAAPWADLRGRRARIAASIDVTGASPSVRVWIDGRPAPLTVTTLVGSSLLDHTRNAILVGAQSNSASPVNRLTAGSEIHGLAVWLQDAVDWAAHPAASLPGWDPALAGTVDLAYGGAAAEWNAGAAGALVRGRCATSHFRPTDAAFTAFVAAAGTEWTLNPTPRLVDDAIGFGRASLGGRGQPVRFVTRTADDGLPGSLRHALTQAGPAYIRLDVEGEIRVRSGPGFEDDVGEFPLTQPDTTLDGRHAPGFGSWLSAGRLSAQASRTVVRDVQSFPGSRRDGQRAKSRDAIGVGKFGLPPDAANLVEDVYVLACTGLWGQDETFSVTSIEHVSQFSPNPQPARRITFDRCLVAEPLKPMAGDIPDHGPAPQKARFTAPTSGGLTFVISVRNHSITVARSLIGSGEDRHPQIGQWTPGVELAGNVIFNWGANGTQVGGGNQTATTADGVTNPTTDIASGDPSFTRMIGNIWLAGPNSNAIGDREAVTYGHNAPADFELIYLDPNNVTAQWSGGALTTAGVAQGVKFHSSRGLSATLDKVPAADLDNPDLFALAYNGTMPITPSVAVGAMPDVSTPAAALAVLGDVASKAGRRMRGTTRLHPFAERVERYMMAGSPHGAARGWTGAPFSAAMGWNGRTGGTEPVSTELEAMGVAVTAGAGQIAAAIPGMAELLGAPPPGRIWTRPRLDCIQLDAQGLPRGAVTAVPGSGTGAQTLTAALPAGLYVVAVAWEFSGGADGADALRIEAGRQWVVT